MTDDGTFRTFGDFYPIYLGEHANRICRRLHVTGTSIAAALLITAVVAHRGGAGSGIRIRLDRPLLLRAQQTHNIQVPLIQLYG